MAIKNICVASSINSIFFLFQKVCKQSRLMLCKPYLQIVYIRIIAELQPSKRHFSFLGFQVNSYFAMYYCKYSVKTNFVWCGDRKSCLILKGKVIVLNKEEFNHCETVKFEIRRTSIDNFLRHTEKYNDKNAE